jgi:hypothetical protein
MRIGFRVLALAAFATVTACGKEGAETFNPITPNLSKVRVRVINATNTNLDFAIPTGDFIGHNTNVSHGNSRCLEIDPGQTIRIQQFLTKAPLADPPTTTFKAGEVHAILVYNPTTTATNFAYMTWLADAQNTPPADSGGLRIVNANPGSPTSAGGAVDLYLNLPASPTPALTAAIRKATNVPVGSASAYFPVPGRVSYQVRVTRTGSTTTANTIITTTATVLETENTTLVLGIPSIVAPTTHRIFSTGGC